MNLNGIKDQITTKLNWFKYKKHFKKTGKNVRIYGKIKLIGNNIIIDDYSTINEGALLNSRDLIKIGKHVRISSYAQIYTAELDLTKNYYERNHISSPVIIQDGVWLCANCIILPGVKIGKGSVVASGAVVNKDIGKFELWGGIPAKKIKDLSLK